MAVDQALLELGELPVLRLYQWSEPTLTLGYFQTARSREQHLDSSTCPLLRRSTGGGAIVHDRELTYSLILPPGSYSQLSTQLYDTVHQAVADRLHHLGLAACRHPERPTDTAPADANSARVPNQVEATARRTETTEARFDPFLCFKRRAAGDLIVWPTAAQADRAAASREPSARVPSVHEPTVHELGAHEPSVHETSVNEPGAHETSVQGHSVPGPSVHEPDGHKVLGSAQRKRDGAILQHGSVLLERSAHAPQLAGINDFLPPGVRPTMDQWTRELAAAISAALGWVPEPSALTDEELASTERLRHTRFTNAAWNLAR